MQSCVGVMATIVFVLIAALQSSQSAAGWTFADFQTQLTQLLFRVAPESDEGKSLSHSLDSLNNLEASFTEKYGDDADTEKTIASKLSPFYSETMRNDVEALHTLPKDAASRLAILRTVEADLSDKERAASNGMGIDHSFPATVSVRIALMKSGNAAIVPASLSIHVNSCLRGNRDEGHVYRTADPTIDLPLPPGCFAFWIETADGKSVSPKPIRQDIGLSAQKPEVVPLSF